MKQINVTYTAPPGDSKVVEMFGHTFYDGKSETVEVTERELAKLQGNRHFECSEAAYEPHVFDQTPSPNPKSK